MTCVKIAIKIAYIGTDFSGSQIQPGRRTVEGELRKGLIELGLIGESDKAAFSGRTDAGVHALCQAVAFKPKDAKLAEPRIINSKMPEDLWVYAKADVPDDFDPRRDAMSRTYRYILYAPEVIESRMIECSKLFLGTHDFTNFSSVEPHKNPVRTVKNITVAKRGDLYIIDTEADSFLWNMVRKMIAGMRLVGSDKRTLQWVGQMLKPDEYREGIPPAPAAGLYLMKIDYPGIMFIEEEYSKGKAYQRMEHTFEWQYTMSEVYREFKDAMKQA